MGEVAVGDGDNGERVNLAMSELDKELDRIRQKKLKKTFKNPKRWGKSNGCENRNSSIR